MNKKKILKIASALLIVMLCVTLAGCDGIKEYVTYLFSSPGPYVENVGNLLQWRNDSSARFYEVFAKTKDGDVLLGKTDNYRKGQRIFYYVDNLPYDSEVYVVTNYSSGSKTRPSQTVKLCKTCNFNSDEVMEIELTDGRFAVDRDIKYVSISGKAESASLIIDYRTDDLIIELNGVQWKSAEDACISKRSKSNDFATTFIVNGNNCLEGGEQNAMPSDANASDDSAKKGFDGKNGIQLPYIVVKGRGSLECKGGQGGRGGRGADLSDSWIPKFSGRGGDGGDGGHGIVCEKLYLTMENGGRLETHYGLGGKRGLPSDESDRLSKIMKNTFKFKLLTSLLAAEGLSITFGGTAVPLRDLADRINDGHDALLSLLRCGRKGKSGKSFIGEIIKIGGIYQAHEEE